MPQLRSAGLDLVFAVRHYYGVPIVQSALANTLAEWRSGIGHRVFSMVTGAARTPSVIEKMNEIGLDLIHTYGLTEMYGAAAVCARQQSWEKLCDERRSVLNARQGVLYHVQSAVTVLDPAILCLFRSATKRSVN
jgi:fatty-acyl-CoA synthase